MRLLLVVSDPRGPLAGIEGKGLKIIIKGS